MECLKRKIDSVELGSPLDQGLPPKLKAPRLASYHVSAQSDELSSADGDVSEQDASDGFSSLAWASASSRKAQVLVAPLTLARSTHHGWQPPLPLHSEQSALDYILAETVHSTPANDEYNQIIVEQFSIYRPATSARMNELTSLDKLTTDRCPSLCFDGVLRSAGGQQYSVCAVQFEVLSVADYDNIQAPLDVYIQSKHASRRNVWYLLKNPTSEYTRFWRPYLWLARFTLYFVEYMTSTRDVSLSSFRCDFHHYLQDHQGSDLLYQEWTKEIAFRDFRSTVCANVSYLLKECYGLGGEDTLCRASLWQEVHPPRLEAVPSQPNIEKRTVVTPFTYNLFRDMYFSDQLVEHRIYDPILERRVAERKATLQLTPSFGLGQPVYTPAPVSAYKSPKDIARGDVVQVRPDRLWKEHAWFAYVQNIRYYPQTTRLDILWLYGAADTILGDVQYPFKNELFLSDHCECGDRPTALNGLDTEHILGKVDISWFTIQKRGLFVRKKFRTIDDTTDFVDIQPTDLTCQCRQQYDPYGECKEKYRIGNAVLIRENDDRLCPAVIAGFDDEAQRIYLQLLHLNVVRHRASRPNEVVPGNGCQVVAARIIRKCNIRIFDELRIQQGNVPCPYNRDGTGDHFYMSCDAAMTATILRDDDYDDDSISRQKSPDAKHNTRLPGMGLFCGGGTFDRGLEEGSGFEFKYAVDWDINAIHSYRANLENPSEAKLFHGSVNDYLARALGSTTYDDMIALPGEVAVIAAGSPCPGFSRLQKNLLSESAKCNASMVASVVSFVDFYAPEYFILENVVTMCNAMGPDRNEYVFQQIVASLVALGYQVQQLLADAWSYGSAQSRSRVFIIATAPGLQPWEHPPHTHGHPAKTHSRALGTASNGRKFGIRRHEPTVFPHRTARSAFADLPCIFDSHPQLCPSHPDHRTAWLERASGRARIEAVPVRPRGSGLMQEFHAGRLRGGPLAYCLGANAIRTRPNSRSYSRVGPDQLIPTVVTTMQVHDGMTGRCVHWDEHRVLTVLEARRAQGYPDEEVLVGWPIQQMRIVGNSVDRKVALVLGLQARDSWVRSSREVRRTVLGRVERSRVARREGWWAVDGDERVRERSVDEEDLAIAGNRAWEEIWGGDEVNFDEPFADERSYEESYEEVVEEEAEDSHEDGEEDVRVVSPYFKDNRATKLILLAELEEAARSDTASGGEAYASATDGRQHNTIEQGRVQFFQQFASSQTLGNIKG